MMEPEKGAANLKTSKSLIIPCATVFISSSCIMILELVAGRIIARYLGSSLYTWTSVIGVVLAGITIGNYLGGRIADRFQAGKALAVLFAISSAVCIATIILNNFVGEWTWLWEFSWPMRIFLHVSVVFLLPSTLLGTISPVVAKMALERGLPTGRTVGDVYAWGAAGSIAGTFAAGYYLIAFMGTVSIIWTVGGVMMLMALLYGARSWTLRACTLLFLCALTMGVTPWQWTEKAGTKLGLRKQHDPALVYEDETQYCYVSVKSLGGTPEKRQFLQDKLVHSEMIMNDIDNLQYSYTRVYATVTHKLSQGKDKLTVMVIGGGGYVYPRYVEKNWPGSRIDVAEIDQGVTEAAILAFGLERDTTINTISMDARNYVDELLEKKRNGEEIPQYDFIYEDAINDYSVPYQLVTKEFNDKIAEILADNGIYMVNLIDMRESGLFLGSVVNTLKQTFPFVSILSGDIYNGDTFVVLAAKHKLDLESICAEHEGSKRIRYLSNSDTAKLIKKSKGLVLTDDYAPVENLLAPVVLQRGLGLKNIIRVERLSKQVEKFAWAGNLPKTLAKLHELFLADPTTLVRAYSVAALIFTDSGRVDEALEIYRNAIEHHDKLQPKSEITTIHYKFAMLLKKAGKPKRAMEELRIAADGYRDILAKDPTSIDSYMHLGNISAENGNFEEAVKYFQKAVDLNPGDLANNLNLIQAMVSQGQSDAAIEASQKATQYMLNNGQKADAAKVQEYMWFLEFKKSKPGK